MLCSAHLHGSFGGRIYSLEHFNRCKFVHQRIHEDEHYRENPSNHELLTVRGGDCCASKKFSGASSRPSLYPPPPARPAGCTTTRLSIPGQAWVTTLAHPAGSATTSLPFPGVWPSAVPTSQLPGADVAFVLRARLPALQPVVIRANPLAPIQGCPLPCRASAAWRSS